MGKNLIARLLDINFPAELRFQNRIRSRNKFVCRGRIQLSLAKSADIKTPTHACYIGVPIFGDIPPKASVTIVNCADQATLALEGDVCIGRGVTLSAGPKAKLTIKQGTYIVGGSRILASHSIQIGQNCAISFGVTIMDDDGHGFGLPPYSAPIQIEDDVWIGCNVTLLKGITIGKGSVVAAGAVVTCSCPPHSLLAGVPARIIRQGVTWTDANRLKAEAFKTNPNPRSNLR